MENIFGFKKNVLVVAEIGNNHEGNFDLAIKMIESAASSGVDAVKFQTFVPENYVARFDTVRLERLNRFKLSNDQYLLLAEKAKNLGIIFFSTPFDLESASFLNDLQPIFKISSGDNSFFPLIEKVARFKKPTIISSGLVDFSHLDTLKTYWNKSGGLDENLCFMHCVSSYPVPNEQANLRAISNLIIKYPELIIGYSDHTLGIKAPVLAVAAGARIIEKHFTLDKNYSNFRDHKLSADPKEMSELVKEIHGASEFMGNGLKVKQLCEYEIEISMRRSIAASRNLQSGKIISADDLTWVRPGMGMPPGSEVKVIGRRLAVNLMHGDIIKIEDLL